MKIYTMNKVVFCICLCFAVINFGSCHVFSDKEELNNVNIKFNESVASAVVGGRGALSLWIDPPEAGEDVWVTYCLTAASV